MHDGVEGNCTGKKEEPLLFGFVILTIECSTNILGLRPMFWQDILGDLQRLNWRISMFFDDLPFIHSISPQKKTHLTHEIHFFFCFQLCGSVFPTNFIFVLRITSP